MCSGTRSPQTRSNRSRRASAAPTSFNASAPVAAIAASSLWESKNHKHWSGGWIDKVRSDQQAEKADVAVVVAAALPAGVDHIGFVRVWVCDFVSVDAMAVPLRQQLDAIKQAAVIDTNRSQVLDDVYEYVCRQEFQHYVTNTVAAALTMKAGTRCRSGRQQSGCSRSARSRSSFRSLASPGCTAACRASLWSATASRRRWSCHCRLTRSRAARAGRLKVARSTERRGDRRERPD